VRLSSHTQGLSSDLPVWGAPSLQYRNFKAKEMMSTYKTSQTFNHIKLNDGVNDMAPVIFVKKVVSSHRKVVTLYETIA